jgi:hypothetical protein
MSASPWTSSVRTKILPSPREAQGRAESSIEDGLSITHATGWTNVKEQCGIYNELEKQPAEQQDELRLKSLQLEKNSSNRMFLGVRRGIKDATPYDDTGVFIKNKWGRTAIELYVDQENQPHFEIYDSLGKLLLYEMKIPRS